MSEKLEIDNATRMQLDRIAKALEGINASLAVLTSGRNSQHGGRTVPDGKGVLHYIEKIVDALEGRSQT